MTPSFGETPLGLSSEIMNLAAILTRRASLKVPRYQRPYTWSEKEVRRLIEDLRRAFQRGATFYFIGQIVLVKNHRGEMEISDGQQRLATLTMIIAYVRDRLPHRAEHYQNLIMAVESGRERPRLILREEDASFYRGYVQEPGKMIELSKLDEMGSDSKDNIVLAAGTIAAELLDVSDSEVDEFLAYVCRCATFNVVDADERGSAATVYNTVNDRGMELSAADNIKCDLLENSRLSDSEADSAARRWEELEDRLGRRHFSTLLNLMPFLLTGEQLISPGDLGAFREQVERSGGVHGFLFDKLPRYCEALLEIFNGAVDVGPASFDVNRRLRMMMQLDAWQWAPAALAFLAEHRGEPERARRFFQALDRLSFACDLSIIASRRQEERFAAAARLAGDDEKLYASKGGPLELTESEQSKFIQRLNYSPRKTRGVRLLLMRLEAAMDGGSVLTLADDATVEHILPRKGAPWWTDRFPDRVLREDAAHVLGNLLLVTDKQNKDADNKPFPEKMKIYFHTKGAPIHALTRDVAGTTEWSLNSIGERQERLVRILCEDWDLVR
jgi:Protein of unknown function DUF262/Protein of unknown function (DUF1524)